MKTKTISQLLTLIVLVAFLISGCGSNNAANTGTTTPAGAEKSTDNTTKAAALLDPQKPISFSLLMGNWKTWDEDMTKDPVGQWITKQTGVTVNVELVTGDYSEKLSLLLATGDLPDFLSWGKDDIMAKFIANNKLLKLDEYLDAMPNVVSMYSNNMNAIKYLDDGHLYSLRQWYMGNTILPDRGFQIKHDFVQKYLPDKADKPGTILLSDLEKAFLDYKAKNPTTADGKKVYPMTNQMTNANPGNEGIQDLAKMVFGVTDWWEVNDTTVSMEYTHPKYVEVVKWLNRWYREGLLDPEFAINKLENMQQKLTTGVSLACICHESETSTVNTAFTKNDPNAYMMYYRVAAEEGQDAYKAYSPIGAAGLCVTTSCKIPDKAVAFLNFMCDPLTNFICAAGVEGGAWKYDSNGNIVALKDNINAYTDTWERFRHFGAYKYTWTLEEGKDDRLTAWKGNVYEAISGLDPGTIDPSQVGRMTFFDKEKLVNPARYSGIDVAAGTDEAVIETKVKDIWKTSFPAMVMAGSEAAAVEKYNETIDKMKKAGLEKYETAVSKNYFKKKALLNAK